MPLHVFYDVLARIEPDISQTRPQMARGGGVVVPELMLSMTLRYLAGGSYLDIMRIHGVANPTFYVVKRKVLAAIVRHYFPRKFPFGDADRLKKLEESFVRVSTCGECMRGCVGAVDGLAVKIKQPSVREDPRQKRYYCRKGFFALNLQAVCDGNRVFTYAKIAAPGSVNDALAWTLCDMHIDLENGALGSYWIAGDAAYGCSSNLLCPHSGAQTPKKKNFDFYLSQKRIHVECAFGLLVGRFGVLWAPLRCTLKEAVRTVEACIGLHNVIQELTAGGTLDDVDLPPTVQHRHVHACVRRGQRLPRLRVSYAAPKVDASGRPVSLLNVHGKNMARGAVSNTDVRDRLANELEAAIDAGAVAPRPS